MQAWVLGGFFALHDEFCGRFKNILSDRLLHRKEGREGAHLKEGASTFDAASDEAESEQLPLLIRPTRLLLYVPAPIASPATLRLPLLERDVAVGTICRW